MGDPKEPTRSATFVLPAAMLAQIQAVAQEKAVPVSAVARWAFKRYLKQPTTE